MSPASSSSARGCRRRFWPFLGNEMADFHLVVATEVPRAFSRADIKQLPSQVPRAGPAGEPAKRRGGVARLAGNLCLVTLCGKSPPGSGHGGHALDPDCPRRSFQRHAAKPSVSRELAAEDVEKRRLTLAAFDLQRNSRALLPAPLRHRRRKADGRRSVRRCLRDEPAHEIFRCSAAEMMISSCEIFTSFGSRDEVAVGRADQGAVCS